MERGSNPTRNHLGDGILSTKGSPMVKPGGALGNVSSLRCYQNLSKISSPLDLMGGGRHPE